jgi:hypothetical protein
VTAKLPHKDKRNDEELRRAAAVRALSRLTNGQCWGAEKPR